MRGRYYRGRCGTVRTWRRRTGAAWNVAVARLEGALGKPVAEVRGALHALDDAAAAALAQFDADQRAEAG